MTPTTTTCDGSSECKAERHLHGCYSDDGTNCDHPSEHSLTQKGTDATESSRRKLRTELDSLRRRVWFTATVTLGGSERTQPEIRAHIDLLKALER